jgi:hypothetical protein
MHPINAKGWLCKANFSKLNNDPIQATVQLQAAWMYRTHYITLGISNYSGWFPGDSNVVADSLSRDDNKLDNELASLFCIHCPSQIPEHFEIEPLPKKKFLWLTALLLKLLVKPQSHKKHRRTKLGCGTDGPPTAAGLDSLTYSLTISHAPQGSSSLEPLPWLCRKHVFQENLMKDWLMAQLQVPSHMYVKPPASTAADPFHPWIATESLDFFYKEN